MDKNFIYGIASVSFDGATIGYIEKGSFDWGGQKPETADVEAEQVPAGPVKTLVTRNATINPTFNLIQLNYANLQAALGGELQGTSPNYTGWTAPTTLAEIGGACQINFVSGQVMTIPSATLLASLGGKLTLTEVSKLECQLKVNATTGQAPYSIADGNA